MQPLRVPSLPGKRGIFTDALVQFLSQMVLFPHKRVSDHSNKNLKNTGCRYSVPNTIPIQATEGKTSMQISSPVFRQSVGSQKQIAHERPPPGPVAQEGSILPPSFIKIILAAMLDRIPERAFDL